MAARINFVIKVEFALVKGYKWLSSMYCIYQVFVLGHVFSNLSKEPFLVAVCCISLLKYFNLFCSATMDRGWLL